MIFSDFSTISLGLSGVSARCRKSARVSTRTRIFTGKSIGKSGGFKGFPSVREAFAFYINEILTLLKEKQLFFNEELSFCAEAVEKFVTRKIYRE